MTWTSARPWLGAVIRVFLGAVWLWAAASKLGSPRVFVQAVRAYDTTPEWLSLAIGYGLPVLEFCLGVVLVVGIATRIAAAASGVLFVVFLVGLIQAAARGIQLDCGCFGGGGLNSGGTQYTLDILRDIGLLILAAFLVVWSFTRVSLEEFLARTDHVQAPSAKRMRTEQGRRKYEQAVAEKTRAARIRTLWLNGSVVVVVVLVSLIGIGVQSGRAKIQGSLSATHASVASGVVYGKSAPVTVNVYEDFQCPHCEDFEKSARSTIDSYVAAGKVQVHFHTISILDASSDGNHYSTRAANAALCASDVSVADFVKYHNLLYGTLDGKQVQPTEGSDGRTDNQLISYGRHIGLTGKKLSTFSTCVTTQKHKALVEAITDQASKDGVNATPTVKVNGRSINPTKAGFVAAVAKAA